MKRSQRALCPLTVDEARVGEASATMLRKPYRGRPGGPPSGVLPVLCGPTSIPPGGKRQDVGCPGHCQKAAPWGRESSAPGTELTAPRFRGPKASCPGGSLWRTMTAQTARAARLTALRARPRHRPQAQLRTPRAWPVFCAVAIRVGGALPWGCPATRLRTGPWHLPSRTPHASALWGPAV